MLINIRKRLLPLPQGARGNKHFKTTFLFQFSTLNLLIVYVRSFYLTDPILDYSGEHNILNNNKSLRIFIVIFMLFAILRAYALPKIRSPARRGNDTRLISSTIDQFKTTFHFQFSTY